MSKSVSSASTLIRGGQTAQHWWRMGWQVLKFATVVGAMAYVLTFGAIVIRAYNPEEMRIAFYYEMAERGVAGQNGFDKSYTFTDLDGQEKTVDAVALYRNPTYRQIRDGFFHSFHKAAWISILPAATIGVISLFIFARTGNRIQENEYVRGAQLVSASQLKAWSKTKWKKYNRRHKGRKTAKPLTISGIPFPPNAVEAQTCLYGTVGVGKSNAMIEMLQTIRENGGRCIIYDRMGTFVGRFYDEATDYIINPFDNRSHAWNPFDDVLDAASFTQMSEVMIPEHRGAASDPFWSQSARIVFAYAARELYKNPKTRTIKALLDHVINLEAAQLAQLISATPGAHFFNEEIEKTAQSIRANLIAELQFLEFLRDDAEAISIRDWMASDEPSFLFLTGDAEHAAATRNIISAILEIAANALMSMGPATEPRCYFFLDEVPTLNRMPFLISSLAEIRQFGGAFVLGYQVYSQLEDIYGREAAQSISGTTNNRIVFNTPDFRTAKLCSESLGNQDIWESNSNISVGAHEARDGVGFSQQRVERSIISPAEIQNLRQFRAAVKFAYEAPTAIVDMNLVSVPETQSRFQPYMGDAPRFGYYRAPEEKPTPSDETPEDDIIDGFHKWCARRFPDASNDIAKPRDHPHPQFKSYYPHFRDAIRAGTPPENIQPIVLVTEGLMNNRPVSAPAPIQEQATPDAKPKTKPKAKAKPKQDKRNSAKQPDDWENRFGPPRGEPKVPEVTDAEVSDMFADTPRDVRPKLAKPAPPENSPKSDLPQQTALPFPADWSPTLKSWE